ncbi:uncharacterized protein IL334_004007 [Kwoniella shivajii]|uniref:E3 ubiquitin-protein ligase UBR7 n=1 Tax=Kwoniella shivajii TaxID=564305 RepID=A0ABZ1D264_9TREE|nr:hypothetical protein IL334_004007 [Kwoniella shivajii]
MESPSSSTRFTLLPTSYLASQPPSSEITLQSLIDTSDRMAEEAREALPYSFDECTFDKGYLRQSVWSCLDCGEKGVCYGCSISCHAEHRLVELWTRRTFKCDCPTKSTQPEPKSKFESGHPAKRRRRCNLYPPESQPQEPNERNHYTQNFKGKFCRCDREYNAETETEAMICCIACEDWFHESCLSLRLPSNISTRISDLEGNPSSSSASVIQDGVAAEIDEEGDDGDDEDEESSVLIRSDSYDGLICSNCVKSNHYLSSQAGKQGWMIIEPHSEGGWEVIGQESNVPGADVTEIENTKEDTKEDNMKRKAERGNGIEAEPDHKKVKIDNGLSTPITASTERESTSHDDERPDEIKNHETRWKWKGTGDIFLANGVREKLKDQLDQKTIASLPFPLEDEEIYEPPKDDDQEETIEQVTSRVMTSLPRVQAIEALHGYQKLKDRLNSMLQEHVASGKTVSKEDIEGLFEQLKGRTN